MAEIKDLSTTDANNTGTAANAGFPENMAYSDVNNAARALEGMIARHFADSNGTLTTTGSSNAYLLTPNRTVAAYTAGDAYMIKASFTNTGAVTINVSSLGAKSIVKPSGDALAAGEITSGGIYAIIYDGTNFQMAGADDPENLTLTSLTVTGTTALNGNTTIGDAASDTVTITADVASDLIPSADGTHDLGAVGSEWQDLFVTGTANIDSLVADTADINAGTIDGTVIGGSSAAAITGTTLTANTSLNIAGDGATVTGIKDEDDMASDSATKLATQQSIKAYVDDQITAQDLDFQADAGGALSVDLDSQTFTLTGGTGIDTSGSGQTVTFDIDSTVATLTGSQTLTNKTLTSPILNTSVSGTAVLDEDNMASDSDTQLATQQSIKAYVDAQITAEDLDFQADSGGALSVDLDSQTFTLTGGTGIDTAGSGQTVTFNIDSTVATLTDTQTLTNKSLTAPTLTGTAVVASLDISGDVDVDGTTNLDVVDIDGAVDMASTLTVGGEVFIAEKLTHTGDTDTHLKFAGANDIRIVAGDVEHAAFDGTIVFNQSGSSSMDFRVESDSQEHMLFVDASLNRIGIANNAPASALDVTGSVTADGLTVDGAATIRTQTNANAAFQNSTSVSGGVKINAFNDAGNASVPFELDGSSLQFNLSAVEAMRISNGNVGIGTANPTTAKLQVKGGGTSSSSNAIFAENSSGAGLFAIRDDGEAFLLGITGIGTSSPSSIGGSAKLVVNQGADGNGVFLRGGSTRQIQLGTTSTTAYVNVDNCSGGMTFDINGSPAVTIDNSSNVGIGTSNPAVELHLKDLGGLSRIRLEGTASGADNFEFGQGTTGVSNGGFEIRDVDAAATRLVIDSSGDATFSGNVSVGGSAYTTSADLNLLGDGLAIKNDKNGSSNNWSLIQNTASTSAANLAFTTGTGVALTLNHDKSATFGGNITQTTGDFIYSGGINFDIKHTGAGQNIVFSTTSSGGSTSEAARFDSSQRFFVGKTSDNDNTAGHTLHSSGLVVHTRASSHVAIFNRTSDDGDVLQVKKDGSLVGSIGASGDDLVIGTGDTGIHFHDGVDSLIPWNVSTANYRDDAISLGTSDYRYKDLYLSGGVFLGGVGSANELDDYE